jgi:hypothetical protein
MRQDRGIEQPLRGRDFRKNVRNLAALPGFGHFDIAIQFEINDVLSGFRNGSGSVCFQQLPRVVVAFDRMASLSSCSVRSGATETRLMPATRA